MFVMVLKLLFILFPLTILAGRFNPGYMGEKNFSHYQGPRDPNFSIDNYQGHLTWEDHRINLDFFNYYTSVEIEEIRNINYELSNALSCPHFVLNKHYDYLRYSNRLITLSYLYESIEYRNLIAKKLNNKNTCSVNWENTLKRCQPRSRDMKEFLTNAKRALEYIEPYRVPGDFSINKFKKIWKKNLKNQYGADPAATRVLDECRKCNKLTINKSLKVLENSCIKDVSIFNEICSEKDSLFGISKVQEPYFLLSRSNITRVFDEGGFASGCLRRFAQQFKHKEKEYPQLKKIFSTIYSNLHNSKDKKFIQGRLFLAGALKEFSDKGLKSIYEEKEEVKVAKNNIPLVLEETIIVPVKKEKLLTEKKIVTKKKKQVKKRKKVVVDNRSSFLKAAQYREKFNLNYVLVDMLQFRYDLQFSIEVLNVLEKNIENYLSYSALKEMQKFDNLGSKKGPVPLMFLKFLIDSDKHQGLYNVLNILGSKFYVNNDIDKGLAGPYDYIELKNDSTTNYNWQISVLKNIKKL